MLGFAHTDLKKSVFYQEVFAEGHQEVRQEGRQEGRQEECVALILKLLQRHFGPLPVKQTRRIHRLPLMIAERLAEDLLDFQTMDDLGAWLDDQADSAT